METESGTYTLFENGCSMGGGNLTAMQPPVLLELREEMSTSDAYPGDLDHKFLEK